MNGTIGRIELTFVMSAILFLCGYTGVMAAETETTEESYVEWSSIYEGDTYDGSNDNGWTYQTHLRGNQVIPEVTTPTMGDAGVSFDQHGGIWHWLYVWQGRDITRADLHCGYWGDEGPVVASLFASDGGLTTSGQVSIGAIDNRDIDSSAHCRSVIGFDIDDTDDLIVAFKSGGIYVQVHSKEHPEGVIRGQFMGDPYDPGTGQNNDYNDRATETNAADGGGSMDSPEESPTSPPTNSGEENSPRIVTRTTFEVRNMLRSAH